MAKKHSPETPESPRHPGGRPPVEIDLRQVEELARIGCTEEDMAPVLRVSVDTIQRRKRSSPEFRGAIETGQASLRNSLRRLQIKKALEGNTAMLIWLGKQLLGQRDKQDLRHGQDPESEPVRLEYVRVAPSAPGPDQPAPEGRPGPTRPPSRPVPGPPPPPASRVPDWEESDFA